MICKRVPVAVLSALMLFLAGTVPASTPDHIDEARRQDGTAAQFYTIAGGEVRLGFNTDFLDVYGLRAEIAAPPVDASGRNALLTRFEVRRTDGIQFSAVNHSLDRLVGGLLTVNARFALHLPDGERLAYDGFRLRVDQSNPMRLQIVGADGQAWLYVNHLMYELVDGLQKFHLRAADLRASPALAVRAGIPELADAYIGEFHMLNDVTVRGRGDMGTIAGGSPNFHGDSFPGGGIYQADVRMENYSMSFSRCRNSAASGNCDGSGPDDGEVVFTPSSTLRNSNTANTADVPWYEKFTGGTNPWGYPYPNADQHPYLIWNLYRILDGQLEQIGASGLKHAWLTTNGGCSAPFGGHILSPNCGDTYGTGNNDAFDDLGPRYELVPATGYWGRCGSIFDTNCDGSSNAVSSSGYRDRLIVRESQLAVAGAQYYSDSWYVVQDDINIYNTMMHKTISPAAGGSGWTPGSQGANVLGPLINVWVSPTANPTQNIEINDEQGHTRIAVKVKTLDACPAGSGLSGTCYRYDYAVHNFDFSRPVYGNPPNDEPPNLRVVSNLGFDSFSVPVAQSVVFLQSAHFADADINAANNWTTSFDDDVLTWTAPASNPLNWGFLYRFSFVTNVAPQSDFVGPVILGTATAGDPAILQGIMMVPNSTGAPVSHTVTASAGSGGAIAPPSQFVPDGDDASFTVTPAPGHVVASVTGSTCTPVDNGDGTWTAANITANCAVSASFSAIQYTVTATGGAGGSITPPAQQVNHGANATFNVGVQPGYHVVGVVGDSCTPAGNGAGTWTASNVTSNCAVTATFALNEYAVTATAGAGGGIAPANQTIVHGGSATFTLTAQPNHHVVAVTGNTCTPTDNGDGTWTAANITSVCTVAASFAADEYTITATAGEGGNISPESQEIAHGGQAVFTIITEGGFDVITVTGDTCTPQDQGGGTWVAENIVADCAVTASFSDVLFEHDFELVPAR